MQKEMWADADTCFSKSLHLKPKDTGNYINRALVRLKRNNLRGAMSDYDTAIEISPNNFLAHYNRGLLRQQLGDDNKAIEDFNYVLEMEPENVMALFNRAVLLDKTGDLKGAIRDYSRVIEKFPNFWTGLQYRAACYRKMGMIAKAEKDEFVILKAQMNKHLGIQQRWSRAKLSAMRKLSDIDPDKYNELVVEDEADDNHEYKSEYRGKVQNRQSSKQFQPYIALTMDNRRYGISTYTPFDHSAESFINTIRKSIPNESSLFPLLGCLGEGTGISTFDIVDRITTLIKTTSNTNEAISLTMLRAVAYASAQNYPDAIKDLNTVLEINPDNNTALWQRAVCSAMLVDYEQDDTPQNAALRYAGVMSDFEKLRKTNHDNAYIPYCQGTFCARRGEYNKAIEYLTEAINQDKDLPHAYFNRGLSYILSGEPAKAKADLSKAGELGLYNAYSLLKTAISSNNTSK